MKRLALLLAIFSVAFFGCSPDNIYQNGDCFIPEVVVNETINTSLPQYFHLQNMGEFIYLEGGNRGIFLVHNYDDAYYAIERTCTYNSDLACSKIFVDSTSLQLKCGEEKDTGFVECCESRFMFDSRLLQGPARCNLKTYRINASGTTLFINN